MPNSSPTITREQARQVDQRAVAEFDMQSLVLMENAGRGVADVFERLALAGPVAICCGAGNNGGDGFVVARHLDLRGIEVRVLVWGEPSRFSPDTAANHAILEKAGIHMLHFGSTHDENRLAAELAGVGTIIDALLGTGSRGEPRPPLAAVIGRLNAHRAPKLAIDLPSGLDCDSGTSAAQTIRAAHTCTFVARKIGFDATGAEAFTGQVHVLDIGAPRMLVEAVLMGSAR